MYELFESSSFADIDVRIALLDVDFDSGVGASSVLDQHDALEAYRAFDDGGLHEAPNALAAYVSYQQRQWA